MKKYLLVPADKVSKNVVVVWRLHYIDTLKLELDSQKHINVLLLMRSILLIGTCHVAVKFAVGIKED